jgi:hypothetical protein
MLLFAMLMTAAEVPAAVSAAPEDGSKACQRTTSHYAVVDRTKALTPHKLTELPPGKTYMAVYRRIDGCEFPMTMVEYRTQGRRR